MAKNKVGRPPKYDLSDPKLLAEIEHMASRGLTQKQIALCLGYGENWFSELKMNNPGLMDAIKRGQASGIQQMADCIFEEATKKKNTALMCFYMKCIAKWRENDFTAVDDGADGDSGAVARRVLDAIRRSRGSGSGSGSQTPPGGTV